MCFLASAAVVPYAIPVITGIDFDLGSSLMIYGASSLLAITSFAIGIAHFNKVDRAWGDVANEARHDRLRVDLVVDPVNRSVGLTGTFQGTRVPTWLPSRDWSL